MFILFKQSQFYGNYLYEITFFVYTFYFYFWSMKYLQAKLVAEQSFSKFPTQ